MMLLYTLMATLGVSQFGDMKAQFDDANLHARDYIQSVCNDTTGVADLEVVCVSTDLLGIDEVTLSLVQYVVIDNNEITTDNAYEIGRLISDNHIKTYVNTLCSKDCSKYLVPSSAKVIVGHDGVIVLGSGKPKTKAAFAARATPENGAMDNFPTRDRLASLHERFATEGRFAAIDEFTYFLDIERDIGYLYYVDIIKKVRELPPECRRTDPTALGVVLNSKYLKSWGIRSDYPDNYDPDLSVLSYHDCYQLGLAEETDPR